MFIKNKSKLLLLLVIILFIAIQSPSKAISEESVITLNLARSHIIELPSPASTILIGNPNAVNAILDNPRRIILMPLQPTATNIMVLDRNNQIILQSIIMVSPRREQAVVIDRHCSGTGGCPPSTMHYCTDNECLDVNARNSNGGPMSPPNPVINTNLAAPTSLNTSDAGNASFSPPAGLPLPNPEPLP
jgi:hypothetical protein